MGIRKINRRLFIRNSTYAAGAMTIRPQNSFGFLQAHARNSLPRWKGFNILDYFSPAAPKDPTAFRTTENDLRWMADWGFDFIRVPIAYPRYILFDPSRNITIDDVYKVNPKVLDEIDKLIFLTNKHGLHISLNLHRGPGYCINAGFNEPFNLWKDREAQNAFYHHWKMWAERYKTISSDKLSFDLLNEPAYIENMNDQFAEKSQVPGKIYHMIAEGAANAIREISPGRIIIADGNNGGNDVTPELISLRISQSCRGYWPALISHYKAPWVWKDPSKAPQPVWPGKIDGKNYGRQQLEDYYKPWIDLKDRGTGVHCGECGCWNRTPHDVLLSWFEDVLDILTKNEIGYALWNFRGDFGILDSGRTDADYTDWYGHKLDNKLLALLKKY